MKHDEALDMFSKWYEKCLENGLEPEKIVEDFGEVILITEPEKVEIVKQFIENL